MDTSIPHSKKDGAGLLLITLLFGIPSIVALGCSFALSHSGWYPPSALWFIYEVSRYVAYIGIAVSVGMIVTVAIQHRISGKYIALMGLSVIATVVVLWCAAAMLWGASPWTYRHSGNRRYDLCVRSAWSWLLLSTMAATLKQSVLSAFFLTMPMTSLSGVGTPISRMPFFLQKLCYFNPLRHIVLLLRSICLQGVGLDVLWPNMLLMAGFASLMLSVSVWRFRKTLG